MEGHGRGADTNHADTHRDPDPHGGTHTGTNRRTDGYASADPYTKARVYAHAATERWKLTNFAFCFRLIQLLISLEAMGQGKRCMRLHL